MSSDISCLMKQTHQTCLHVCLSVWQSSSLDLQCYIYLSLPAFASYEKVVPMLPTSGGGGGIIFVEAQGNNYMKYISVTSGS